MKRLIHLLILFIVVGCGKESDDSLIGTGAVVSGIVVVDASPLPAPTQTRVYLLSSSNDELKALFSESAGLMNAYIKEAASASGTVVAPSLDSETARKGLERMYMQSFPKGEKVDVEIDGKAYIFKTEEKAIEWYRQFISMIRPEHALNDLAYVLARIDEHMSVLKKKAGLEVRAPEPVVQQEDRKVEKVTFFGISYEADASGEGGEEAAFEMTEDAGQARANLKWLESMREVVDSTNEKLTSVVADAAYNEWSTPSAIDAFMSANASTLDSKLNSGSSMTVERGGRFSLRGNGLLVAVTEVGGQVFYLMEGDAVADVFHSVKRVR